MRYVLLNRTNYGDGVYVVGTFRSEKRARDLAEQLSKPSDVETGDSWTVRPVQSLDPYTDESILEFAKQQ